MNDLSASPGSACAADVHERFVEQEKARVAEQAKLDEENARMDLVSEGLWVA